MDIAEIEDVFCGLRTGHSRGLVRRVLRGQRCDVFMPRDSSLERHPPWLDAQWAAGERNAAALWRELKALGFRGGYRVVAVGATRRRRADAANLEHLKRTPSARTVARLMTTARDDLSRAQTVLVAAIEGAAPKPRNWGSVWAALCARGRGQFVPRRRHRPAGGDRPALRFRRG